MTGVSQAKKEKRIPGRGRQEGRPWGGKGFKKLTADQCREKTVIQGGDRRTRQGQREELGPDHQAGPYEPYVSVNSKFSCIWPKQNNSGTKKTEVYFSHTSRKSTDKQFRAGVTGLWLSGLGFLLSFYSAIKHVASVWQVLFCSKKASGVPAIT